MFGASASKSKNKSSTSGSSTSSYKGSENTTSNLTGGSTSATNASATGQQTGQWGGQADVMRMLPNFLSGAAGLFGGGGGATPYGSKVGQQAGQITEWGSPSNVQFGVGQHPGDQINMNAGGQQALAGKQGPGMQGAGQQGQLAPGVGGQLEGLLQNNTQGLLDKGSRRDTEERTFALDDITRRVNQSFSQAGRYGSPAHSATLARELGRFQSQWQNDARKSDVTDLQTGLQSASTLQGLRLNPTLQFGGLLSQLGGLGGDSQQSSGQKSTSQTDDSNWQKQLIEKLMTGKEDKTWKEKSKGSSSSVSAGFGI